MAITVHRSPAVDFERMREQPGIRPRLGIQVFLQSRLRKCIASKAQNETHRGNNGRINNTPVAVAEMMMDSRTALTSTQVEGDQIRKYYKGSVFRGWFTTRRLHFETIVHGERDLKVFVF